MISYLGLGIICLAWLFQLIKVFGKHGQLQSAFVGMYAAGVLLLVVDGYTNGLNILASLNLVTFILSGTVLLKMGRK